MFEYLTSNMRLTTENLPGGRMIVDFVVRKDGSITDVRLVRGVEQNPSLGEAFIRTVKGMPKWVAGTVGGEPVDCSYSLPMVIDLR